MKQSTKVLLPLGLFMSIVIPVTVKSLFTDTDFFDTSESSKIDYLQPYKIKPEVGTEYLKVNEAVGETATATPNSQNPRNERESSGLSRRRSREKDLSLPAEALTLDEIQAAEQTSSTAADDLFK
ncbi:MAG TPA: hypothetical protein VF602_04025 [Pedobacter sp.]|jgi:hypothetical protein